VLKLGASALAWAALCLLPSLAVAAPLPAMPALNAAQVRPYCDDGLKNLRRQMKRMEATQTSATAKLLFRDWNRLQIALEDLQGPIDLLNSVSTDEHLRKAAEQCLTELGKFSTELYQDPWIYNRFVAVQAGDTVDAKLAQDTRAAFEDTGVALPASKRARMREILERLSSIAQEFWHNLRKDEQFSVAPAETAGIPAGYLAKAKRDAQGNYLLGYGDGDFQTFMEHADSAEARKRYLIAFANLGSAQNPKLLSEAAAFREELANLFGLPSYADLALRHRMANSPVHVRHFLDAVASVALPMENDELETLRRFQAESGNPGLGDAKLNPWDAAYLQQAWRNAHYQFDQEALRAYFPVDAAVRWILNLAGRQYGLEFTLTAQHACHPDVQ
jgi:thimet oligopeptidase